MQLPNLPGGKKIVYSQKNYPITDVTQFGDGEMEQKLKAIVEQNNGLWCAEAEKVFLEMCEDI